MKDGISNTLFVLGIMIVFCALLYFAFSIHYIFGFVIVGVELMIACVLFND